MEQRYIVAHRHITHLALAAWLAACTSPAWAQLPSFNGAEGYGGTFTGSAPAGGWFSNGSVYHVTTTQDLIDAGTGKPAIGTLRGAFYDYTNPNSPKQMASNRVVVFDVGGTFQLTQGILDIKTHEQCLRGGPDRAESRSRLRRLDANHAQQQHDEQQLHSPLHDVSTRVCCIGKRTQLRLECIGDGAGDTSRRT